MSRRTVRSLVMVALLVASAVGAGVAGAQSHSGEHREAQSERAAQFDNRTQAQANASMHLHVHTRADGESLVVTVAYEGEGAAQVAIEGTDAAYRDGGRYEVESRRTLRLSPPERSSGISVGVETPTAEYTRTVEYEWIALSCGETAVKAHLPGEVTTTWTVTAGNHTRSDSRTVDLPTPELDCEDVTLPERPELERPDAEKPEQPEDGDSDADRPEGDRHESERPDVEDPEADRPDAGESEVDRPDVDGEDVLARINEALAEHERELGEDLDALRADAEQLDDDAHDRAHGIEDEAHEQFRERVRDANRTAHDAYGRFHGESDALLQAILSVDPATVQQRGEEVVAEEKRHAREAGDELEDRTRPVREQVGATVEHAREDGNETRRALQRDRAVVENATRSLVQRVVDDAGEYGQQAERKSEETGEYVRSRPEAVDERGDGTDSVSVDGEASVSAEADGEGSADEDGAHVEGSTTVEADASVQGSDA